MSPSKNFMFVCLAFVGGIFVGPVFSELIIIPVLIIGILLSFILWQHKLMLLAGVCMLFFAAGIFRWHISENDLLNSKLAILNDVSNEVTISGLVAKEPEIRSSSSKILLRSYSVDGERVSGKILITASRYPEYKYGDNLILKGELKDPPIFEGFNYREFLRKDGIVSVMYMPQIEFEGQNTGNYLVATIYDFKKRFEETAQRFISPPEEGLLEALAFGSEKNIPDEFKEKLNMTGTRHIAAVSGMNITILISLVFAFLLSLGLWRKQAFYLSLVFLLVYVLMIGAPPSAVRAGIMGGIVLLAQHVGRLSLAGRMIIFAACLMLAFNPQLLRLDVGFQLSFLATMGLIYLQDPISKWLQFVPEFKALPIKSILSATMAAQVFTLPVLVYNFGTVSLISPIANLLVVPILAPITILIFVFGLSTMMFSSLGYVLSVPVWIFLKYITLIVDLFSRISFASVVVGNIHWLWMAAFYCLLAYFILYLKKENIKRFRY